MIFSLYFYTKEAYVEKIISALTTIGQIGFGKDASVGKGRFHLISDSLCELKVKNVFMQMQSIHWETVI